MTTVEKNVLIAEYHGTKSLWHDGMYLGENGVCQKPEDLRYHFRWEWIIPVLEKITVDPLWDEFKDQRLWDYLCTFSINGCLETAVDFIQWKQAKLANHDN